MKKKIDKLIYAAGIFALVMTIPQITKIWIGKDASGVSLISWSAYIFLGISMLMYGVVNNKKPLIVIYSFWNVFYVLIVAGILIYG